jgi:hypothetical protein
MRGFLLTARYRHPILDFDNSISVLSAVKREDGVNPSQPRYCERLRPGRSSTLSGKSKGEGAPVGLRLQVRRPAEIQKLCSTALEGGEVESIPTLHSGCREFFLPASRQTWNPARNPQSRPLGFCPSNQLDFPGSAVRPGFCPDLRARFRRL